MEGARTHFNGRVFQSRRKLSLGETRESHENLLQLGKTFSSGIVWDLRKGD